MIHILLLLGLARASVTGPLTLPLGCDVWFGRYATENPAEARRLRAFEDEHVSWYQFDGPSLLARSDLADAIVGQRAAFIKRTPTGLRFGKGRILSARFSLVPSSHGPRPVARIDLTADGGDVALMVGEDEASARDVIEFRLEPTARHSDENPLHEFRARFGAWTPVHYGKREFHYQFFGRDHEREANLLYARVWPREDGLALEWRETDQNVFDSTTLRGRRVALLYRTRGYADQAGRLAQPRVIEGTLGRVLMVRVPDRALTLSEANSPVYYPRTLLWEFIEDVGLAWFPLQEASELRGLADLRLIEPLELRVDPAS